MSLLPSKPDTTAPAEAEPRVIGVDSDDADDVISALSSETARKLLAELHEDPAPPSELADRVDTSLQNAQYHLEKLEAAGAVSVVDTAYSAKGREMDVYAPSDQPLVIFAGDDEKTTGLKAAISRLLGGLGVVALGSIIVQTLYGDAADSDSAVAPGGAPANDGGSGNGNGGAVGGNGNGNGGAVGGNGNGNGGAVGGNGNGAAAPDATTVADGVDRNPEYVYTNVTGDYKDTAPTSDQLNETIEITEPAGTAAPQPDATATPEGVETTTDTLNQTATEVANQTADRAPEATKAAAGIEPGLLFFAGGLVVLALWMSVWYVRNSS